MFLILLGTKFHLSAPEVRGVHVTCFVQENESVSDMATSRKEIWKPTCDLLHHSFPFFSHNYSNKAMESPSDAAHK